MSYLPDFWLAWDRHADLLREADRERLVSELRRAQEAREEETQTDAAPAGAAEQTEVRRGLAKDASRVAELLELNGMPRWVAFEEQFIVAERDGKVEAVLRYREDLRLLYLGLLVTDPRAEADHLAVSLYAGARTIASDLGVREIRAGTRRHETHLARAGYRKGGEGWRLDVEDG